MQHGDIRRTGLRQPMAGFWRQYITETIAVIVHIVGCQAIFTVDRYSQKKTDEACGNFKKAKELGDPNADELITKYCK